MSKSLTIKTKNFDTHVKIGDGEFNKFFNDIKKQNCKKFILIDLKIYNLFKSKFNRLNKNEFYLIKIKASEKIKSFKIYWKIVLSLLENKIDRSSIIIAIGGGTIGDVVGFISSTILRGVKLILIPTTLLSQADSSIGGKNGINSKYGKNLIGTFFQPSLVVIDPIFLKSLPKRQIKSGYAEIIKHAIIFDNNFFKWLDKNYSKVLKLRNKEILHAIKKSVRIKSKFIESDEKEKKENFKSRTLLNFGHTFGHAMELKNKYNFNLMHGEAISLGMVIAVKISNKFGILSLGEMNRVYSHLKKCGLPVNFHLKKNDLFFKLLINDKKTRNNNLNIILLKKIGKAYLHKNFELKKIKSSIL